MAPIVGPNKVCLEGGKEWYWVVEIGGRLEVLHKWSQPVRNSKLREKVAKEYKKHKNRPAPWKGKRLFERRRMR